MIECKINFPEATFTFKDGQMIVETTKPSVKIDAVKFTEQVRRLLNVMENVQFDQERKLRQTSGPYSVPGLSRAPRVDSLKALEKESQMDSPDQ